jgi:hypothetical protein
LQRWHGWVEFHYDECKEIGLLIFKVKNSSACNLIEEPRKWLGRNEKLHSKVVKSKRLKSLVAGYAAKFSSVQKIGMKNR